MPIALGIDTGGTYTDAVLFDQSAGRVLAAAKALTTYYDLAVGIRGAISALFGDAEHGISPPDIALVSLSTTLATNAIVEGNASPVALILIGYDENFINAFGFREELVTKDVVFVRGGHDGLGEEVEPLDEDALRRAILARKDHAEAFAISAYFSVRNPAHELRAKEIVAELTDVPATCGHELTSRLNAVRRATTTALNAGLIPLLADLITTVRATLDRLSIAAPLMVVKGDGSLVRADWAMQRPIETILSGPAASAVGAEKLAARENVWVIDMGGTTTDIAGLKGGRPRLNEQGAQVGRWRTMVEAVDMHTLGLGGDSEVRVRRDLGSGHQVEIGPRRVIPLSLLCAEYPEALDELRYQFSNSDQTRSPGRFVLAQRKPRRHLAEPDRQLIDTLMHRPLSIDQLMAEQGVSLFTRVRLDRLTAQQRLMQAAFTPTDALHVLGLLDEWDAEAAQIGAALLAQRLGAAPEDFCREVVERVSRQVAGALLSKVLADEGAPGNWANEPTARALVERAFIGDDNADLTVKFTLSRDIVGIGAPVRAYLPRTADLLNTRLTIPAHAEVANAVGAVAGSVLQHRRVEINQVDDVRILFRAHLPDGVHDFGDLEAAVGHAERVMRAHMAALAQQAGATQAEITMERIDHTAPVAESWGDEICLGTELFFAAAGRPGVVTSIRRQTD